MRAVDEKTTRILRYQMRDKGAGAMPGGILVRARVPQINVPSESINRGAQSSQGA